ncbi:unnamed protein product [Parascedosporium putredinis]|uniref:Hydroxymethylglutaryl-CoA synthase n=1 Tax=Parascedosporium putredinis TaxID=1442378 RepID=A0A9P1HD34_9PEZI|nr:unnamed protein product [Parascedosporium putredinis]CAI8003695.1 unnamed protein product [Parascedosporium putredinis]
MTPRPENVGIKAIEIYFPSQYVEQSELESFDGVSAGKYTIGLGQTRMSFCDDREDIYSFSLTVVSNLLKKNNIDTNSIGRLEVGTETLLDKSKHQRLFNAVNWVESSAWDGRDAIVVAADIALYAKGNARPTGGAGAVALLIGPNAPIVAEPGLRGTYMQHAYDFYKPDLTSEYPYVDGHFSLTCYTRALDAAYRAYCAREASQSVNGSNGSANDFGDLKTPLDRFDYLTFHAPTCKLVQKSYGRLLYHDYLANVDHTAFAEVPKELREMDYEKSLTDKVVEKTFMNLSKKRFQDRVDGKTGGPPETYDSAHLQKDYKPQGDASTITSGTYYLENVDDMFKRTYSVQT